MTACCRFETPVIEANFLSSNTSPLTSDAVSGLEKISVSTGVRKPGKKHLSDMLITKLPGQIDQNLHRIMFVWGFMPFQQYFSYKRRQFTNLCFLDYF